MIKRLNDRVRVSRRIDDNFEIIKKRISNFNDQTVTVFDYYRTFGKVRTINASLDESEIQTQTLNALMPQIMFMIGAKKSGKTALAEHAAQRTNLTLINFKNFIKQRGLKN